jgi:ketosteroid isomerase-like protein
MAQKDVELVRRAFEADLQEAAATYWHPEIEYVEDPRLPGASSYRGRDQVLRCWQGYLEVLGDEKDISATVEDVLDAGARLVPLVRFQGRTPGGGLPFDHWWSYVVELKDEQIAYMHAYYEPHEALEAAGLAE